MRMRLRPFITEEGDYLPHTAPHSEHANAEPHSASHPATAEHTNAPLPATPEHDPVAHPLPEAVATMSLWRNLNVDPLFIPTVETLRQTSALEIVQCVTQVNRPGDTLLHRVLWYLLDEKKALDSTPQSLHYQAYCRAWETRQALLEQLSGFYPQHINRALIGTKDTHGYSALFLLERQELTTKEHELQLSLYNALNPHELLTVLLTQRRRSPNEKIDKNNPYQFDLNFLNLMIENWNFDGEKQRPHQLSQKIFLLFTAKIETAIAENSTASTLFSEAYFRRGSLGILTQLKVRMTKKDTFPRLLRIVDGADSLKLLNRCFSEIADFKNLIEIFQWLSSDEDAQLLIQKLDDQVIERACLFIPRIYNDVPLYYNDSTLYLLETAAEWRPHTYLLQLLARRFNSGTLLCFIQRVKPETLERLIAWHHPSVSKLIEQIFSHSNPVKMEFLEKVRPETIIRALLYSEKIKKRHKLLGAMLAPMIQGSTFSYFIKKLQPSHLVMLLKYQKASWQFLTILSLLLKEWTRNLDFAQHRALAELILAEMRLASDDSNAHLQLDGILALTGMPDHSFFPMLIQKWPDLVKFRSHGALSRWCYFLKTILVCHPLTTTAQLQALFTTVDPLQATSQNDDNKGFWISIQHHQKQGFENGWIKTSRGTTVHLLAASTDAPEARVGYDPLLHEGIGSLIDLTMINHFGSASIKKCIQFLIRTHLLFFGVPDGVPEDADLSDIPEFLYPLMQEKNCLAKVIDPERWPDFLEQIGNYDYRAPLRKPIEGAPSHFKKFVHNTGTIVPYEDHRKHLHRRIKLANFHTKKMSFTLIVNPETSLITRALRIGILCNKRDVIVKARLSVDSFTHQHRWVGTEQQVNDYQAQMDNVSFSAAQEEEFLEAIKTPQPNRPNEILAKINKKSIVAVFYTRDGEEEKQMAKQYKADLCRRLGLNVPLVRYTRGFTTICRTDPSRTAPFVTEETSQHVDEILIYRLRNIFSALIWMIKNSLPFPIIDLVHRAMDDASFHDRQQTLQELDSILSLKQQSFRLFFIKKDTRVLNEDLERVHEICFEVHHVS